MIPTLNSNGKLAMRNDEREKLSKENWLMRSITITVSMTSTTWLQHQYEGLMQEWRHRNAIEANSWNIFKMFSIIRQLKVSSENWWRHKNGTIASMRERATQAEIQNLFFRFVLLLVVLLLLFSHRISLATLIFRWASQWIILLAGVPLEI